MLGIADSIALCLQYGGNLLRAVSGNKGFLSRLLGSAIRPGNKFRSLLDKSSAVSFFI
jgi:hypothetical protein